MSQAPYTRPESIGTPFSFEVFSNAWNLFKEDWQPFVVYGLSAIGLPIVGYLIYFIPYMSLVISSPRGMDPEQLFGILPVMIFGLALASAGILMMTMGYLKMAYLKIDTDVVRWTDGWRSIPTFGGHLAVSFLVSLITTIGSFLLYIPGLIASAALWLSIVIYADPERSRKGVIDALKDSWSMTKGALLHSFLFTIILSLVAQLGVYALGIGIVATAPIAALAAALQKRRRERMVFGSPSAPPATAPPPPQP